MIHLQNVMGGFNQICPALVILVIMFCSRTVWAQQSQNLATSGALIAVYVVAGIILLIIVAGLVILIVYVICWCYKNRKSAVKPADPYTDTMRLRLEEAIISGDEHWIHDALEDYRAAKATASECSADDGNAGGEKGRGKKFAAAGGLTSRDEYAGGRHGAAGGRGRRFAGNSVGPNGETAADELEVRALNAIVIAKEKKAAEAAAAEEVAAKKRAKKSLAVGGGAMAGGAGAKAGRGGGGMGAVPNGGVGVVGYGVNDGYNEEEDETDPDDQVAYALRRDALQKALDSGNTAEVSRALRQFEHMLNTNEKLEKEEELLRRSRDHLDYLRTRDEVYRSMGQTPPGGIPAGAPLAVGAVGGGFMSGFASEFGPGPNGGADGVDGPKPGEELGPGALGHNGPKLLLDPPTLRTLGGLARPHPMHVYVATGFLLIMGYKEEQLRNWQHCREILRGMAEGEKARARPIRVLQLKPDVLLHTRVWLTKYHAPEVPVARAEAGRVVDWCRRVCDAFDAQEDLVVVPPWQRST